MPKNPVARFLLALVMIAVGGIVTALGFMFQYPLGFVVGAVVATFGFLDIFGFGKRHPNR